MYVHTLGYCFGLEFPLPGLAIHLVLGAKPDLMSELILMR